MFEQYSRARENKEKRPVNRLLHLYAQNIICLARERALEGTIISKDSNILGQGLVLCIPEADGQREQHMPGNTV
jgi:hypothetical protein